MSDLPGAAAPLTLRLLGGWRLEGDVSGAADAGGNGRRLLAMLALRGPSTRAQVRGTLWPSVAEAVAASRLRTVLWRLSRARRPLLAQDHDVLGLAAGLPVDVHEMQRAAAQLHAADPYDPVVPAASLFSADLLPHWQDDWLLVDRERIRQTRLHALEALAARLTAEGSHAAALDAALQVVQADPLRESGHRAVIRVHLAEDNAAEALRQYHYCAQLLRDELGVEPSATLRTMVGRPV